MAKPPRKGKSASKKPAAGAKKPARVKPVPAKKTPAKKRPSSKKAVPPKKKAVRAKKRASRRRSAQTATGKIYRAAQAIRDGEGNLIGVETSAGCFTLEQLAASGDMIGFEVVSGPEFIELFQNLASIVKDATCTSGP